MSLSQRDRHEATRAARIFGRLALALLVASFSNGGWLIAQDEPVISFAAADDGPAAAAAQQTTQSPETEPTLSFSFRYAPWDDVLTKFAEVAGYTLDVTELPSGTFNYIDKGRYRPQEALDVLNGYLLQRGFVLVRRDRFLVCVNLEKGIPANLIPRVTADQLADFGKNELVSVILTHASLDAAGAATQIKQLQGPHGAVVSLSGSNALLVTDTAGNVRLINRLIEQGAFQRRTTSATSTEFKSFPLQYVRAADAERLVRQMFGLPPAAASYGHLDGGGESPTGPGDVQITTDTRTNRLFATATSAKLSAIEQLVSAYDVPVAQTDGPRPAVSTTRILPLGNADVIIIGQALKSLSPRIRVSTTRSTRPAESAEAPAADGSIPSDGTAPATTATPGRDGRDR